MFAIGWHKYKFLLLPTLLDEVLPRLSSSFVTRKEFVLGLKIHYSQSAVENAPRFLGSECKGPCCNQSQPVGLQTGRPLAMLATAGRLTWQGPGMTRVADQRNLNNWPG
jgi:hypothetical protein